ncbi:SPX domain-containing protein 2 [Dionaea muscipula]
MKFGKSLCNQIEETLPEWRDKFLSYKELKKRLKQIGGGEKSENIDHRRPNKRQRIAGSIGAGGGGDAGDYCKVEAEAGDDDGRMTKEEIDFIKLLEDELEKFNSFFVEKEEEYIIRLKELQERVANAKHSNEEETVKIRKEIVDFHGEMVLLENYSALNYTGLVKILKKYDKRTGALIRLPFIQGVLQQPFFTTDLLYTLVKECERMLDDVLLLFTEEPPSTSTVHVDEGEDQQCGNRIQLLELEAPKELEEIEQMENLYMKSTILALKSLQEMRSKSSTVSMFSLPPLQLEETCKKVDNCGRACGCGRVARPPCLCLNYNLS